MCWFLPEGNCHVPTPASSLIIELTPRLKPKIGQTFCRFSCWPRGAGRYWERTCEPLISPWPCVYLKSILKLVRLCDENEGSHRPQVRRVVCLEGVLFKINLH